jgi:hypothetical protein
MGRETPSFGMRTVRISHRASLAQILIISK